MVDGELFSRVYIARGIAAQDNKRFRLRLLGYLEGKERESWYPLSQAIRRTGGLDIAGHHAGFEKFFQTAPIQDVLDFVTLYRRHTGGDIAMLGYRDDHPSPWLNFVAAVFREENLGYKLDKRCGVHYFVDQEYELNRVSALQALDTPPLRAVRDAFEAAQRYLDPASRDTKASVRAAFEALEILAKLIFPDQQNLNKKLVETRLKALAQAAAEDETERLAAAGVFDGLASMINAIHLYRHGQAVDETVAPSLNFTVYFLSVAAASLRWMVALIPLKGS